MKLAGFWTAQSMWGWVVLLPITVAQVRRTLSHVAAAASIACDVRLFCRELWEAL